MSTRLGEAILGEMVIGSENANGWKNPKTNWTSNDYFNADDYNRIIGNISYLKQYMQEYLFSDLSNISLGPYKDYTSYIYAKEMNLIENSLEKLNLESYGIDIGKKTTYKTNGKTPLWIEFNRIESATLLLYSTMIVHENNKHRLSFTLGGDNKIKM